MTLANSGIPNLTARGKMKILVPTYVFVTEAEWIGEIDQPALCEKLERFKTVFLGGDAPVPAAFQSFDEPSIMVIAPLYLGKPVTNLANLHTVCWDAVELGTGDKQLDQRRKKGPRCPIAPIC